jgi:hypothetical protein
VMKLVTATAPGLDARYWMSVSLGSKYQWCFILFATQKAKYTHPVAADGQVSGESCVMHGNYLRR